MIESNTTAGFDAPYRPGPDWSPISEAPTDQAVRLYWPRVMVDDDGEMTTTEDGSLGMSGVGAYIDGWPAAKPSPADLDNGYLLDWVYGPPTYWRPWSNCTDRPGYAC